MLLLLMRVVMMFVVMFAVCVFMTMLMGMPLSVVLIFMAMAVFVAVATTAFVPFMLILVVSVRRAFVNPKLDAFDRLALLALEVHVKVANIKLREFPLERGGLHTKVA